MRETLQNSWDARVPGDDWTPAYGVRVYPMDLDVKQTLRDTVFTDLPDSLSQLAESLNSPNVHAIEIYDRGTVGLNGPYRASEFGEPNNFTSFVFDIGTTKESKSSGGTYGFGKTATFEVSNAHSVVYWSRCRGIGGQIEHRFIASSLHEPYVEDGARYTGAHWWGMIEGDDDVVPIRGEEAQALGEAIFRTHFGDADDGDPETGTSILVIDPLITFSPDGEEATRALTPVRTEAHAQSLLQQVTDALAHSAWPKMIPIGPDEERMLIGLYNNGIDREVSAQVREQYSIYASALTAIRRDQREIDQSFSVAEPKGIVRRQQFPITLRRPRNGTLDVSSLFGTRTSVTIGHLYLIESVKALSNSTSAPANTLCLMRHEAELVVRYQDVVAEEESLLQWHGVFKPTAEFDHHFRAAEPPTHDRWTPDSAESEASHYVVKKALEHLKNKTRSFLSESRAQDEQAQHRSVRNVAMALRGFVPHGLESERQLDDISPRRRARRASPHAKAPRSDVDILSAQAMPSGAGQTLSLLPQARDARAVAVSASVYALTSDGRLPLTPEEVTIEWRLDDVTVAVGPQYMAESGRTVQLLIRTHSAAALEVGFESEAVA